MASPRNVSRAKRLLAEAAGSNPPQSRLDRHLLVAAALSEVLTYAPVVVGGTAEEFWTAAEYHETDLDLCAPLVAEDRSVMERLGFEVDGRHWYHAGARVAVEFPDSRIEGDESRITEVHVGDGIARLIGLDDLYLDRLKQSTAFEGSEGVEFMSALAVAVTRYEDIDWPYVGGHIEQEVRDDPSLGHSLRRLNRKLRQRARRVIAQG
jgi:hypothetical protein